MTTFETRYEWLRPGQLIERRDACPLIIVPVAPLEYHGPHLPVGVDAINATEAAHAACRRLGKGVVLPTMMIGTERERDPATVEALGFAPGSHIVGMDFPTRLWNSHYLPEEVFALRLAAELRILIDQGYRYVFIANGHGATNHQAIIDRICIELSRTTPARLGWRLTLSQETLDRNTAGHANLVETALMMHDRPESVDLGTLPPRDVPIRSWEFSIVDGVGFTPDYHRDRVVRDDPRDATAVQGRDWRRQCVEELAAAIEQFIA